MLAIGIMDASAGGERSRVEVEASATLFELRQLLLTLTSFSKALAHGKALQICFDGRLLTLDQDGATLAELGLPGAPVLVILVGSAAMNWPQTPQECSACAPSSSGSSSAAPDVASSSTPSAAARTEPAGTEATPAAPKEPPATEPSDDATCRICFSSAYENGSGCRKQSPASS